MAVAVGGRLSSAGLCHHRSVGDSYASCRAAWIAASSSPAPAIDSAAVSGILPFSTASLWLDTQADGPWWAHAPKDLAKHPSPFFLTDREREQLLETEASGLDVGSVWIIAPTLYVDADKLEAVLAEVERFATWFDETCFDQLHGRRE